MHQMKSFMAENELITRQDNAFGLETNIMIPPGGGAEASANATEATTSDPARASHARTRKSG
jgi:hypothetical protein